MYLKGEQTFIFNFIQEKRIKSSLGPVYMYVGDLR